MVFHVVAENVAIVGSESVANIVEDAQEGAILQPFLKLLSSLVMENSPRWCYFTARMVTKFRDVWKAI